MVTPGYQQKVGKRQGEYYKKTRDTILGHHDRLTDKSHPGARHAMRKIAELLDMLGTQFDPPADDLSDL